MTLSHEQSAGLALVQEKLASGQTVVRVGGLAGTGKTYMTAEMARWPGVVMAAPTNKAASVLQSKAGVVVRTLHSLLYQPYEEIAHEPLCQWVHVKAGDLENMLFEDTEYHDATTSAERSAIIQRYQPCPCPLEPRFMLRDDNGDVAAVVIVDEASMVSGRVFEDLVGTGCQVVLVGDYGQLPPVKDTFMALREETLDVCLRTVHRQEAGSAVLDLAHAVRRSGRLPGGTEVGSWPVVRRGARLEDGNLPLMLCYTNRLRMVLNLWCRERLGRDELVPLVAGERLICVDNVKDTPLSNGVLWTVTAVGRQSGEWIWAEMESDYGSSWKGPVNIEQLTAKGTFDRLRKGKGHAFMYGYALTVHKAQGSEADRVVLFLEGNARVNMGDDYPRWLYTGITRARSSVRLVNA